VTKLLVVVPFLLAQHGSIDPFVFGQTYCFLRQQGVSERTAINQAVDEAWRPNRTSEMLKIDVPVAKQFVETNCQ
jgi:hypothetical protein